MSEFEEFARSQGFSGDFQRGCNGQYKSDLLHFMEKAFMHQQSEIDQLKAEKFALSEKVRKVEWLLSNNSFEKTIKNCLKILRGANDINLTH